MTVTAVALHPAGNEETEALNRLLKRGVPEGPVLELLRLFDRATALVLNRESTSGSYDLLRGMQVTTLAMNKDLPGMTDVVAAGLGPLLDDECPFPRIRFKTGKLRAVIYCHRGVWHFLATGTAAIWRPNSENQYCAVLVDLITVLRPRILAAASISRLLRSVKVGATIHACIDQRVSTVRLGTTELVLSDAMSGVIWSAYAPIAATERNLIVQRLLIGKVNKWRRGEWLFGDNAIPPGYCLTERRLAIDEAMVGAVKRIIELLADPRASSIWTVGELGKAGLRSREPGPGRGRPLSATTNHSSTIRGLAKFLPLYATGKQVLRLAVPFPGLDDFAGLPVNRVDGLDDHGFVELPYDLDVPPGGWADADLLETALQAWQEQEYGTGERIEVRPQGRAAGPIRRLFSHVRVRSADGEPLRLRADRSGALELVVDRSQRAAGPVGQPSPGGRGVQS
ncbi:hypothetical protein KSP35_01840 [Aquihabitans sp. G128]|uniref:hypothetical protein n=1 Tax=Aquihabitans sp. G128 TaxID=2849779 RepID=UPI001C24AC8C|nr:hypothetical protein [Aquihabitans sp. G128]QXC61615.1 hypothetical protein KSP35_01840 [Aquihabitans sp. G128]